MRFRTAHLACLLLLLSSLAVSDARAGREAVSRTPGGVFVRNLLLQAAVEESLPTTSGFGNRDRHAVVAETQPLQVVVRPAFGAAMQTAQVHAVTGSSL